jgi:hypothetical protein
MKESHCRVCYQELSSRVARCPRCGDTDTKRAHRAAASHLAYQVAGLVAAGLAIRSIFW